MDRKILVEILGLCLDIEKKAEEVYLHLAEMTGDEDLKSFWDRMSAQETMHIGFWENLLRLAESGSIPQVFENPEEVLRNLLETHTKVTDIEGRSRERLFVSDAFLLAYRLEFYLLNPGLATLFQFVKTASGEKTAFDVYDDHLNSFVETMKKYGSGAQELELLGETIQRMWKDNRRLSAQSHIDSLTGLLNRRGLSNTMVPLAYLAKREEYPVGVLIMDIDDFKDINDNYGHQKGDDILRKVARMILRQIRKSDLIGRYGGEEFIVFLSPVDPSSLAEVAENLRLRIKEDSTKDVPMTVSVGGVSSLIKDNVESDLQELIRIADQNMLKAKKEGKDRIVVGGI